MYMLLKAFKAFLVCSWYVVRVKAVNRFKGRLGRFSEFCRTGKEKENIEKIVIDNR